MKINNVFTVVSLIIAFWAFFYAKASYDNQWEREFTPSVVFGNPYIVPSRIDNNMDARSFDFLIPVSMMNKGAYSGFISDFVIVVKSDTLNKTVVIRPTSVLKRMPIYKNEYREHFYGFYLDGHGSRNCIISFSTYMFDCMFTYKEKNDLPTSCEMTFDFYFLRIGDSEYTKIASYDYAFNLRDTFDNMTAPYDRKMIEALDMFKSIVHDG